MVNREELRKEIRTNKAILNRLEWVKSNPNFLSFSWQTRRLIDVLIQLRTDIDTASSELDKSLANEILHD